MIKQKHSLIFVNLQHQLNVLYKFILIETHKHMMVPVTTATMFHAQTGPLVSLPSCIQRQYQDHIITFIIISPCVKPGTVEKCLDWNVSIDQNITLWVTYNWTFDTISQSLLSSLPFLLKVMHTGDTYLRNVLSFISISSEIHSLIPNQSVVSIILSC